MFYKDNNSAKLLNIEDVIVQKVENTGNELHVYMMLPRKMHKCPCCGSETNRVHDYRDQKIKDVPLGGTTYLHLRKRRYACGHCGKRFAEKNPIAARYYRLTRRCVAYSGISSPFNIAVLNCRKYSPLMNSKVIPAEKSTRLF